MNFHDVSLPKYIEIFAVGSSQFSTSLARAKSGSEVRNSDSQLPLRRYVLKDCSISHSQFESFNSFFKSRAGQRFSFKLRDPFDHKVVNQPIATGDGVRQSFQLHKTYIDPVSPCMRIITKPVFETIRLTVDGQEVAVQMFNASGVITLAQILPQDKVLHANFEFDVVVRFSQDSFTYSFNSDGTIGLENIELIEVLDNE